MPYAKQYIQSLLDSAGIQINGPNAFDIQVYNDQLYRRMLRGNSLALGESYMEGWWDAKELDVFFFKIFQARLHEKMAWSWSEIISFLHAVIFNLETKSRSFIVGRQHYDIGNDIYAAMLGKTLTYSCGYWKDAQNLDQAQEAKHNLICQKIGLKKGDRVLDIGCGWGSFLKFAAKAYGAKGTGITVSKEQAALAKNLCTGLPIEILLQDYRDTTGKFDHIVSVGMFEHVGVKNYRTYMEDVNNLLKDDGLFLLHTIGSSRGISIDPWIEKYIFPNSMLPSAAHISKAIEGIFVMEDWHNFGAYYDKTLMAWFENFNAHWLQLQSKYSETFYRMWKYYLLSCAASFRARHNQLWQIILSKRGVKGGYVSVR
ncbi:MAG: cyclopropane-fatty-acyl-phospholipid synthase [Candidatus Staskawiczbacteria bacterium RIFCSPLOWO2_01_FULL_40_39]|uniref:Cyclopropane-fatty-acyl-phospholipid synthase n=1 Tax=Candidatus Staskawiczbacteria bacterium RIFCSPHIGHO2_01_FULL_39_25 TaxID=1802202 RepID=A0A1G2HQN3_9BACT|nr:MAG: cyclopropane-fatty-acyl-phospholipid synthase [Candidatus Staskawiczbacteria bacterium RIFCSPHIGHO2_01_FULL_39_25]OGZ72697.1 MAG: cyclopropane-fatty-acyl-phospholipid synthase [Candidatus Staskawiczbacteria bacterium RIFCSPLOWO2_01_FULL_40_39]OGZ75547.1 MAG: cyclopropane-fatty-acyl-phospholipid synthase [Candidatus Staskawiczbacteria bacterium RIFCSPLOWO2_02_FULL_39_8]